MSPFTLYLSPFTLYLSPFTLYLSPFEPRTWVFLRVSGRLKYLKHLNVLKTSKRKKLNWSFSVDNFFTVNGKNFVFKFFNPKGLRPSRRPSVFATPSRLYGLATQEVLSRGEEGLPPLNPPSFLGKGLGMVKRGGNSQSKIGAKTTLG